MEEQRFTSEFMVSSPALTLAGKPVGSALCTMARSYLPAQRSTLPSLETKTREGIL